MKLITMMSEVHVIVISLHIYFLLFTLLLVMLLAFFLFAVFVVVAAVCVFAEKTVLVINQDVFKIFLTVAILSDFHFFHGLLRVPCFYFWFFASLIQKTRASDLQGILVFQKYCISCITELLTCQ